MIAATTTAWGDGDPLDVVLERIAQHDNEVDIVELSIGARPVPDGPDVIAEWSDRFEFLAHHTSPIGDGASYRPSIMENPRRVAQLLSELNIRHFSGHPPGRRDANEEQMWYWAERWHETLGEYNITWAVETMYTPRTREEIATSGGYHLATPAEVWDFCEKANQIGWEHPLLIDVSHLHIGWTGGDWSEQDVIKVLQTAPAREIHVSMNDGRRDLHRPVTSADIVLDWAEPFLDRFDIIVDEGRRRKDYSVKHFAA